MREMNADETAINDLANVLEKLWSGGWGESGVYTVAIQREKLRPALEAYMNRCRQPE